MRWNQLALAAMLQLGLAGVFTAAFGNNELRTLEDLLAAKTEPITPRERRQAGGRCGADGGGAICPGSQCCSAFGYCGNGDSYCPQIVGCQPAFGWCEGEPLPSSSSSSATTRSSTPTSTLTSSTSSTSSSSSTPPTGTSSSSISPLATSSTPSATSTSSPPTGPLQISQNGMCGNATTCAGSRFGRCCSQFFYCGNEDSFCGGGCQSQFGSCGVAGGVSTMTLTTTVTSSVTVSVGAGAGTPVTATATVTQTVTSVVSSILTMTVGSTIVPTSSSAPATTSIPATTSETTSSSSTSSAPTVSIPAGMTSSTDGTCGNGVTCLGSGGGQCCSQWNYCGDDRKHCVIQLGCQPDFGHCDSS